MRTILFSIASGPRSILILFLAFPDVLVGVVVDRSLVLEIFSNICQCWKLEMFPGYNSCIAETCVSFMAFNRNYQNSLCRGHLTSSFRTFGRSNRVPRRSLNPAVHPSMMHVSMMPDSYVHIACIHDVYIRNPCA